VDTVRLVTAVVIYDSAPGSGITLTLGGGPHSATKPTSRRSVAAISTVFLTKIPNPLCLLRIFSSLPEIDGHIFELHCWILYPRINPIRPDQPRIQFCGYFSVGPGRR
jgi:hypothetical protein